MAGYRVRETFFRPDREYRRASSTLPADLHNGLRLLLSREETPGGRGQVFLPIRALQYLAIADREEVIFVDGNGPYAHRDGEGGRPIAIAWRPADTPRASLTDPVPYDIVYYAPGLEALQRRLVGETRAALAVHLARQRDRTTPDSERRAIPFRRL